QRVGAAIEPEVAHAHALEEAEAQIELRQQRVADQGVAARELQRRERLARVAHVERQVARDGLAVHEERARQLRQPRPPADLARDPRLLGLLAAPHLRDQVALALARRARAL